MDKTKSYIQWNTGKFMIWSCLPRLAGLTEKNKLSTFEHLGRKNMSK